MEKEMDTPRLVWLRERVMRLKKLLDEPQPGLISWLMAYSDVMKEINDFWHGGNDI